MSSSSTPTPSKYRAFLIFGAPGCGKGTQGAILATIPRFHYFSCGDVFRSLDVRSPIGQKFVAYSSRGELVPDELTVELWKQQIEARIANGTYNPENDILWLDGIPRSIGQARLLEPFLDVLRVFHLSCPDREELTQRIRRRALKQNRLDDANETTIRARFKTYDDESKPVLAYYTVQRVSEIDASQAPVKVFSDILLEVTRLPEWPDLSKPVG